MPRKVDPGTIRVGKGLAPEGTVEDNSLRYPERDADPLRVHIHDPSRSHMASSIGIVDEGHCYTSDEVEGALQELCGGADAGRSNGLIAGGTFVETIPTSTGDLTLTLVTPTEILMNGHVFEAGGLQITLPAVDDTYFIYCDCNPVSPDYETLQYTTTAPPEIETATGVEHVMIALVKVTNTGTILNSYQDARFFVRNLDRKVQYTSRKGENVDAWSEGCFATINAAFFWMEWYGDGGTSEDEKGILLVRGLHEITSPLTIPTNHVTLKGDGEAIIRCTSYMSNLLQIDTSDGERSDITIEDLIFQTEIADQCAIRVWGSNTLNRFRVIGCRFEAAPADPNITFARGMQVGYAALVRDAIIRDNVINVMEDSDLGSRDSYGILLNSSRRARIEGNTIHCAGNTGNLDGIVVHPPAPAYALGDGYDNVISGCTIDGGCAAGIALYGGLRSQINGCVIQDAWVGIDGWPVGSGAADVALDTIQISDCTIVLDDSAGLHGIRLVKRTTSSLGPENVSISGCSIKNPRTNFNGDDPFGIRIEAAENALEINVRITGCSVDGFYARDTGDGAGLAVSGDIVAARGVTITGNVLEECSVRLWDLTGVTFTGNTVNAAGYVAKPLLNMSEATGLQLSQVAVTGNIFSGTGVATTAIEAHASGAQTLRDLTISDNSIFAMVSGGIEIHGDVTQVSITGNNLDSFVDDNNLPTGTAIDLGGSTATPRWVTISSNNIKRWEQGILVNGLDENLLIHEIIISDNIIDQIAQDQATRTTTFSGVGSKGIAVQFGSHIKIQGNSLTAIGDILNADGSGSMAFTNGVWSVPILAWNSSSVQIEHNSVNGPQAQDNTVVVATGFTNGIIVYADDLDVRDIFIHGNQVKMVWEDTSGGIAYNAHGIGVFLQSTTASHDVVGVRVTDNNVVTDYADTDIKMRRGILFDSTGSFGSTDAAYGGVITNCEVSNNVVFGFIENGIAFRGQADAAQTSDNDIHTNKIENNQLTGLYHGAPLADQRAILLEVGAENDDANCRRFDICNNQILDAGDIGIELRFESNPAAGGIAHIYNLNVVGNHIHGLIPVNLAATVGIKVVYVTSGATDAGGFDGSENLAITDNVIRGTASRMIDVPIYIDLGADDFTSLNVDRNICEGSGDDSATAFGYMISVKSSDSGTPTAQPQLSDLSFCGNTVRAVSVVNDRGCIFLDLYRGDLKGLKVDDNTLITQEYGSSWGLAFYLAYQGAGSGAIHTINNYSISGNKCTGDLGFFLSGASLVEGSIANNLVTLPDLAVEGTTTACLAFTGQSGGYVTGAKFAATNVTGNVLTGGTYGVNVGFQQWGTITQFNVSDNSISGQNDASGGVKSRGIFIDESFNATVFSEVSFCGNQISGPSYGIHCVFDETPIQNFKISDNSLHSVPERAIWLELGGGNALAGASVYGVSIVDNTLTECGGLVGDPIVALEAVTPVPGNIGGIHSVMIAGNQISHCGIADTGSTYIYCDLSAWQRANNVQVSRNQLQGGIDTTGILSWNSRMRVGIDLLLAGTGGNQRSISVQVDGNTISDTNDIGIRVDCLDETESVSICNNDIRVLDEEGSNQIGIKMEVGGVIDATLQNARIDGNTVQIDHTGDSTTGHGILLRSTTDDGTVRDLSVSNNVLTGGARGVWLDLDDPTMSIRNCSVSNNKIGRGIDELFFGIDVDNATASLGLVGESCWGLSVSNNTVLTGRICDGTSGAAIAVKVGSYGAGAGTAICRQIQVDHNLCYLTSPGAIPNNTEPNGIYVVINAAEYLSEVSVDHNKLRNFAAYSIYLSCFIFPPIGQAAPNRIRYISIAGNQIQSQTDAITPVGSLPYSNLLLQFYGGVSRGVTIANNVSQCQSTTHGNMSFVSWGSDQDTSKYWFVHNNLAENSGGNNVAGVMASGSMVVGGGGLLTSWTAGAGGEPEYMMVHDNISDASAQDKFNSASWIDAGGTGSNHDNDDY